MTVTLIITILKLFFRDLCRQALLPPLTVHKTSRKWDKHSQTAKIKTYFSDSSWKVLCQLVDKEQHFFISKHLEVVFKLSLIIPGNTSTGYELKIVGEMSLKKKTANPVPTIHRTDKVTEWRALWRVSSLTPRQMAKSKVDTVWNIFTFNWVFGLTNVFLERFIKWLMLRLMELE